jgi:hypothetical protein
MKDYRPYKGRSRRWTPIDAAVVISGVLAALMFIIALAQSIL